MLIKIICIIAASACSYLLVANRNRRIIKNFGTVVWAYGLGVCFSLLMNALSKGAFKLECSELLEIIGYMSIAIGIPLILFENSIEGIKIISAKSKKAFALLIVSAIIVTVSVYFIFTCKIEDGDILSGMALAIYTGGTPNLNAVAYTFNLNSNLLLAANLSDIVIGGVFYLFIIAFSKSLAKKQDKRFDAAEITLEDTSKKISIKNLFIAIGLAIASAMLGALIWMLTGKADGRLTDYLVPFMMVGTSVGGILFSGNEKVKTEARNDDSGQFFLALFSFSIASLINVESLTEISKNVFIVFFSITVATFFVHMLLCKLFGIDIKTMIVTSTAGIYGPAFIPGVCTALNSKELLKPGLVMGSLGYIIGTFLGIALVICLSGGF